MNKPKGPIEVSRNAFDFQWNEKEGLYHLILWDKDDNRQAVAKYDPAQLHDFALRMLTSTGYRLADLVEAKKAEDRFVIGAKDAPVALGTVFASREAAEAYLSGRPDMDAEEFEVRKL